MAIAYDVVRTFEEEIAKYAGAPYAVAVESCCAALFLCCKYIDVQDVFIPKRTYPGVGMAILNAGGRVHFRPWKWQGTYRLKPYNIVDGALRFRRGMYEGGFHCLSFHAKKQLPIGRGGMILTKYADAAEWFRQMRFDGRKEMPLKKDNAKLVGYNMYLTPEQASRGLQLFDAIKDKNLPDLKTEDQGYPDLSKWDCFRKENQC